MGNTLLTPPEIDPGRKAPILRGGEEPHLSEIEEEGVLSSLWGSLRDVLFPPKLPPLVLESKPIPVIDRMKVKRDPVSTAIAFVVHVVVIALIAWLLAKKIPFTAPLKPLEIVDLSVPPKAPPKAEAMGVVAGSVDRRR